MTASTLTDERVLITGGAGFIGTALARALVPQTTEVVLLDSLHPDVHGDDPQPPAIPGTSFVLGDVTSPQAWQQLLKALADSDRAPCGRDRDRYLVLPSDPARPRERRRDHGDA